MAVPDPSRGGWHVTSLSSSFSSLPSFSPSPRTPSSPGYRKVPRPQNLKNSILSPAKMRLNSSLSSCMKGSTSPVSPFIGSRVGDGDLHSRLLDRIKTNKLVSGFKSPLQGTKEADTLMEDQEVEQYLTQLFFKCDQYRTGQVRADSLLKYLSNLVETPKLETWRLEELGRLLDPKADNRYVDLDIWLSVGQSWVEMMLDCTSSSLEDAVEGVGEPGGCSSMQVELESRVVDLEYIISRMSEEKEECKIALSTSEEQVINLTAYVQSQDALVQKLREEVHRAQTDRKSVV